MEPRSRKTRGFSFCGALAAALRFPSLGGEPPARIGRLTGTQENGRAPPGVARRGRPAIRRQAAKAAAPGIRVLKKYPNRRLYDTQTSATSRWQTSSAWCLRACRSRCWTPRPGDLTRSILLQIILEEETGGVPLFSTIAGTDHFASTAMRHA